MIRFQDVGQPPYVTEIRSWGGLGLEAGEIFDRGRPLVLEVWQFGDLVAWWLLLSDKLVGW